MLFRSYGVVKVRENGGVDSLGVVVTAENYKAILELFKKALIENAGGYDAKDDRLSGNPNQMNIQSMYDFNEQFTINGAGSIGAGVATADFIGVNDL